MQRVHVLVIIEKTKAAAQRLDDVIVLPGENLPLAQPVNLVGSFTRTVGLVALHDAQSIWRSDLSKDPVHVVFHCLLRKVQPRRNLLIREPFPKQSHKFFFSPAQDTCRPCGDQTSLDHIEQAH